MKGEIPIEVSARHIHPSRKDLEAVFGKEYRLRKLKFLPAVRHFAAKETVDIQVNSKVIPNVRILGPLWKKTQVEISHTDAVFLGIKAPIRDDEDLEGTPGITLLGPKNKIKIKKGVINAWRHIHCNPEEAGKLGLKNNQLVSVKTAGRSSITFHNVMVKVKKNHKLCMHLDTDEGNATCITKTGKGKIVR